MPGYRMAPQGEQLERGYKLGKYEVIGRISLGGMAELYLAFLAGQGGFRKFVALKRVLPAAAEQESFLKMFLDEARITASLSHANIAQVYELAENPENDEPVLAMEFVAGQNLAQITRRAQARRVPLPIGFTCRVVHDVLLGLHSAHHFVEPASGKPMPVIHRDINPRNLMVTYTGGTKIIDFGIAKARGRLDTTQVGMVKGTLQYMSPEQVMQGDVTGRSDLFAVSVVLWELLAGRRLFDEQSDAALITRIVQADVPQLADAAPSLPPGLAEVVMKGLARNAEERWRTGREYARALDQAVPELFDDEQVAELMGRLFEDKIAITRTLLQSTTTDASFANLKLMTQAGDEGDSKPGSAPQPIVDVPTGPTHPRLGDAAPPPTVSARPAATAATLVLDGPVAAAPSDQTEANLEPVGPRPVPSGGADEVPTSPDRPRVDPAVLVAPPRKRTLDTPAAPAPRTATSDPAPGRKPTSDATPARKPTSDGTPARKPTANGVPARKLTAEKMAAAPAPEIAAKPPLELLPVRRATADAQQVLAPVAAAEVTHPGTGPGGGGGRGLWIGLVLALVALAGAVAFYVTVIDRDPARAQPLEPGRPVPPPRR